MQSCKKAGTQESVFSGHVNSSGQGKWQGDEKGNGRVLRVVEAKDDAKELVELRQQRRHRPAKLHRHPQQVTRAKAALGPGNIQRGGPRRNDQRTLFGPQTGKSPLKRPKTFAVRNAPSGRAAATTSRRSLLSTLRAEECTVQHVREVGVVRRNHLRSTPGNAEFSLLNFRNPQATSKCQGCSNPNARCKIKDKEFPGGPGVAFFAHRVEVLGLRDALSESGPGGAQHLCGEVVLKVLDEVLHADPQLVAPCHTQTIRAF
eukprot:COSAG04_NODE_878_length_9680_cov_2.690951_5_plen_260_part_00